MAMLNNQRVKGVYGILGARSFFDFHPSSKLIPWPIPDHQCPGLLSYTGSALIQLPKLIDERGARQGVFLGLQGWSFFWTPFWMCGYGSIPMKIPFLGEWTSIKSQLFWCELQGYKVLTHCHVWRSGISNLNIPWKIAMLNRYTVYKQAIFHSKLLNFRRVQILSPNAWAIGMDQWGLSLNAPYF